MSRLTSSFKIKTCKENEKVVNHQATKSDPEEEEDVDINLAELYVSFSFFVSFCCTLLSISVDNLVIERSGSGHHSWEKLCL